MANPQRRPSQRLSRNSSISSHRGENIFSDENEIDSFGVADGYRPTLTSQHSPSSSRRTSYQPQNHQTVSSAQDSKKKPLPSQQSAQPLVTRNSFSLQHDAQYSDTPRPMHSLSSPTNQTESSHTRQLSTLSRQSTFARPMSTYNGPLAPSHPYGMYPQNANEPARQPSVASSHRPVRERSYLGGDRPTHPYGMYIQHADLANETDPLAGSADIASVGFPGLRQEFARRLGPNGEDADDIIGPDGHTEQLPPYTPSPYPDVGTIPQKSGMASVPLSSIPQEPFHIADSGTSDTDVLLPRTNQTPARHPRLQSYRNSNFGIRETISEKSKQRTCFGRMPLWLVVVVIILLITIGAVGGGVIGQFLSRHSHGNWGQPTTPQNSTAQAETGQTYTGPAAPPSPSTTSDPDSYLTRPPPSASTLTISAGGANAAPTGSFPIIFSHPPQKSKTCLSDDEQQAAWDCADLMQYNLTVENPYNKRATVTLTPVAIVGLYYGDQNSSIQAQVDHMLVNDPDEPDYGEAYYFSTPNDKHVILHETDLPLPAAKQSNIQQIGRRTQPENGSSPLQDKDMVWDCWWNGTAIDGFIYIQDKSSTAASKRNLHKRDTYARKMKMRQYRKPPAIPPQCTHMQYINQQLVPSTQPPTVISLAEISPPLLRSAAVSHWHHGWSKHHKEKDDDDTPPVSFCECEWMFS